MTHPIDTPSSKIRALPRLIQILGVLARHGFLGAVFGRSHWPSPQEARKTLEELGIVFLKFGQVLAMRRDLLPSAYIDELEMLHDELPAMPPAAVRRIVKRELDAPLTCLFSSFSEGPIGSATIAQVHEACLPDGRRVAVKVQRPDLGAKIAKDMAALTYLVAIGERMFPRLRQLDMPVIVREFSASLKREIDFTREARSLVMFRTAMADSPDLWIPDVIADRSKGAVLTMEFSAGERVDAHAKTHPEAMPRAMNTLVTVMLQTIFEQGLFHADPHPGNVFVLPDGRVALLDFGNMGELDQAMRESLTRLLGAVVDGDARAATDAYLDMSPGDHQVERAALLQDIKAAIYEIRRTDLAEVSVGDAFEALLRAGSRNGVHNPGEFVLLTRAFVLLESMVGRLAPDFDYMQAFRREITRLGARHFSPASVKEKSTRLARDVERLVTEAPDDARRVLRRMAEGDLGRLPGLEALGSRFSRNLERLARSVSFAALVISGSLLLLTPMGGWHHTLGEVMIVSGITGMLLAGLGALRRDHGPGQR